MRKTKNTIWFVIWYRYCLAYLELAHIGIIELKNKNYQKNFDLFAQSNIYTDKIVLVPIIWCLKHAIELLCKALTSRINKDFLPIHDNDELHEELKLAFSSLRINDSQLLRELILLSDKYYKLNFWNSFSRSNSDIKDNYNDVFRYPESKVNFSLDIQRLHEVTEDNQIELESDIKKLETLLFKLNNEITGAKNKLLTMKERDALEKLLL